MFTASTLGPGPGREGSVSLAPAHRRESKIAWACAAQCQSTDLPAAELALFQLACQAPPFLRRIRFIKKLLLVRVCKPSSLSHLLFHTACLPPSAAALHRFLVRDGSLLRYALNWLECALRCIISRAQIYTYVLSVVAEKVCHVPSYLPISSPI